MSHKGSLETFSFTEQENKVLDFWNTLNLYERITQETQSYPLVDKVDGPPFPSSANLHHGHILVGFMKSVFDNYWSMHGKKVNNKLGYDCHGLPIEQVVSKNLGLNTNQAIREYGIDNYNKKCEETIQSHAGAWEPIYKRIGRFANYQNEYKTMDTNFMETVWWVFKQLWEKGLVYQGYKIMPYSTECGTSLSASEASGDDVYKEVIDTAVYVKFQVMEGINTYLIAWTTTPWTLPSNITLVVNKDMDYVKIKDLKTGEFYILAKNSLGKIYDQGQKKKKTDEKDTKPYEILLEFKGDTLEGTKYKPIFKYFEREFQVYCADYVEEGSGTGIVHTAPSHGQEDFDFCIENRIVELSDVGKYCFVDDNGRFMEPVSEYKGEKVFDANPKIVEWLKQNGFLVKKEQYRHKYPHCWRTDTPLIYKAASSFFIRVTDLKDKLIANNEKVNWIPEHIGKGRFKQWLSNARDWGVSRTRFFGTPLPVWISDDGEEMICIGSIDELVEKASLKERPTNLHPQYMKDIQIPSERGKGMLNLVNLTFDCWFESGCVPYGQLHYPFENKEYFESKEYICDFICEGLDQTRGWFYTLMVLSTALFNKPAFKNVICNGLILAADGKKFSKRLGNFVSPIDICNKYSADAMRLYLVGSPAAHADSFQFNEEKIGDVLGKYYQWYNAVKFLIEHLTKFQKDDNVFDINAYQNSNNIMDLWILSRVRTLLQNIESAMNKYTFDKVKPEIMDFIEDLTNWYIKFNRNRLRGRYCSVQEQGQAISTLFRVEIMFIKIAAPFAPFLTETMYQKLLQYLPDESRKLSVHLCNYPCEDEFPHNTDVERAMKRLQIVAGIVRNLRMKSKVTTTAKMPIKEVIVVNEDDQYISDLKALERYMCEEINSIKVSYLKTIGTTNFLLIPDSKNIGQTFKAKAAQIKGELGKLSQADITQYLNHPETGITVKVNDENIILNHNMFAIKKEQTVDLNNNQVMFNDQGLTVIADMSQDDEVLELFTMRLFITTVQKMRKNTYLKPWNKIGIYYETDSQLVNKVVNKFYDQICEELIYKVYEMKDWDKTQKEIKTQETDLNGQMVKFTITDFDGTFLKS